VCCVSLDSFLSCCNHFSSIWDFWLTVHFRIRHPAFTSDSAYSRLAPQLPCLCRLIPSSVPVTSQSQMRCSFSACFLLHLPQSLLSSSLSGLEVVPCLNLTPQSISQLYQVDPRGSAFSLIMSFSFF
jgi:hypothetical protein